QHRARMTHLLETLGRLGADALRRAVVPDQLGKAFLDFIVAAAKRIVFGIADARRVFLIIATIVLRDVMRQTGQLPLGFFLAELGRRFVGQLVHGAESIGSAEAAAGRKTILNAV